MGGDHCYVYTYHIGGMRKHAHACDLLQAKVEVHIITYVLICELRLKIVSVYDSKTVCTY